MSEHIERPEDWVDAAISATGMAITGRHTLDPRKRVVDVSIAAHTAYLWGKANQAISVMENEELRGMLRRYTTVLLGPEVEAKP